MNVIFHRRPHCWSLLTYTIDADLTLLGLRRGFANGVRRTADVADRALGLFDLGAEELLDFVFGRTVVLLHILLAVGNAVIEAMLFCKLAHFLSDHLAVVTEMLAE